MSGEVDVSSFLEQRASKRQELDEMISRLELILGARMVNIFIRDQTVIKPPSQWAAAEQAAAEVVNCRPDGSLSSVRFMNMTAVREQLNRLKGFYNLEKENENPLEAEFRRVDREVLKDLLLFLRSLGDDNPSFEVLDGDV